MVNIYTIIHTISTYTLLQLGTNTYLLLIFFPEGLEQLLIFPNKELGNAATIKKIYYTKKCILLSVPVMETACCE